MTQPTSEMALIGAALLDASVIDAATDLSPSDFTDRDLGQVWGLFVDMRTAGEPLDHAVVVDRLQGARLLGRIGGVAALGECSLACQSAGHAPLYANEIKSASRRRRLQGLGTELTKRSADTTADPVAVVDWLDSQLSTLRAGESPPAVSMGDATTDALQRLDAAESRGGTPGLSTGFSGLDRATGGLYGGETTILAARPSIGKSALAVQIATAAAAAGVPAMVVSLEMSAVDIAMRSLARALGREVRAVRFGLTPESRRRAGEYASQISDLPLFIWNSRSATVTKIRAAARVQKATKGLGLLVVDYLGLIAPQDRRKPRWEQIGEASKALKTLAQEMEIPIVVACQLGREAEKAPPRLDHLRDAGAIEQDADVVMLLHRESRDATRATLNVAKQRNGPICNINLDFDPSTVSFADAQWSDSYQDFA